MVTSCADVFRLPVALPRRVEVCFSSISLEQPAVLLEVFIVWLGSTEDTDALPRLQGTGEFPSGRVPQHGDVVLTEALSVLGIVVRSTT